MQDIGRVLYQAIHGRSDVFARVDVMIIIKHDHKLLIGIVEYVIQKDRDGAFGLTDKFVC